MRILAFFICIIMMLSCGNKSRHKGPIDHGVRHDVQYAIEPSMPDTVPHPSQPSEDSSVSEDYSYSASQAEESDDYDNMRGFDPASEDDMDDNGMSRYMENDDDEGWD